MVSVMVAEWLSRPTISRGALDDSAVAIQRLTVHSAYSSPQAHMHW